MAMRTVFPLAAVVVDDAARGLVLVGVGSGDDERAETKTSSTNWRAMAMNRKETGYDIKWRDVGRCDLRLAVMVMGAYDIEKRYCGAAAA